MKKTTTEAVAAVEPDALTPLSELAVEGFGWGGYVTTTQDAIAALAAELVGKGIEILLDDLGRRCVSRDTARQLFAERAADEQRRVEQLRRQQEDELVNRPAVSRGVPAVAGLSAWESMMLAAGEEPKRRRSVIEHALANTGGVMEYHPIRDES